MRAPRLCAFALLVAVGVAACGRTVLPPVVTAPHYPDFIAPELTPADVAQSGLASLHEVAWRWLQQDDLARAEREFQAVLKRSAAFLPSEAGLGYVELARKNYPGALDHFDRVLKGRPAYVSAVLGRGEALLAQSRDTEALASFESAVKLDPRLVEIGRRVEVLRARAAQEMVAEARRAAQAGQLDEAERAYGQAIAASPGSAFLLRDLADVQLKQGRTEEALANYRRAVQLDPSDVMSRIRIGEILERRSEVSVAIEVYSEANALEPSADLRRRLAALEARMAYLKLPAEYRAIPQNASVTRGDLAALIGNTLAPLLSELPARAVVITDTRNNWASDWIMAVAAAGVIDPYENHTFQPRNAVTRAEMAQAVSRLLKIVAARKPELLRDWQSRQQKMTDVGVSNLNYADASLSVAAGILPLAEGGLFQLSRPVSGAEAIDAVNRLERLFNASK